MSLLPPSHCLCACQVSQFYWRLCAEHSVRKLPLDSLILLRYRLPRRLLWHFLIIARQSQTMALWRYGGGV